MPPSSTTATAAGDTAAAPAPRRTLAAALTPAEAAKAHGGVVAAGAFLAVYDQFVCPFMDGLPFVTLVAGLLWVLVPQIALRAVLWRRWAAPAGVGLARHGWRIAVLSWLAAGVLAVIVHGLRYEAYPPLSYLKLVTGFWVLGGGLMAQFEYTFLEDALRRRGVEPDPARRLTERITRRLLESMVAFAVAPAAALAMMAVRQVEEGHAEPVILAEAAFLSAVFLAVAAGVALHYGRSLRRDTEAIVEALDTVATGRFDVHMDATRADELGRVALGINDMAAGLSQRERIRDAFGRFVSPAVAARVLADAGEGTVRLHGERREVTVLMCDLRDFTALAEDMEPEALTALLNGYLTQMVAAVHAHHGMVDKFIGDAVMAVFGLAPCPDGRTPERMALDAAREMRARLAAFNARNPQGPRLAHGIGIHAGPVVAGTIGSHDRLEFTVIGATVNLAARIEAQTRVLGEPILLSDRVAQALGPEAARPVAEARLKGVREPVRLWAPCPEG